MIDEIRIAWRLAATYHAGQQYGGQSEGEQIQYLEHIGAVLLETQHALSFDVSLDKRLASLCAILHDILEDTEYTTTTLEATFGADVLKGVQALTKNESLTTKQAMMQDSLQRISQCTKEIAIVKMSDRICNLHAPPFYWNTEKKKAYLQEARLIHQKLGASHLPSAQRLAEKIAYYEANYI